MARWTVDRILTLKLLAVSTLTTLAIGASVLIPIRTDLPVDATTFLTLLCAGLGALGVYKTVDLIGQARPDW